MASHIPFIVGAKDCDFLKKYLIDSVAVRVSLELIGSVKKDLPKKIPLWIDPAVDGYHHILEGKPKWDDFGNFINQFEEHDLLTKNRFIKTPDTLKLKKFVFSILNKCNEFKPDWISIPQLPLVNDTSRNKVNRALASITKEWKKRFKFKGKLILPIIFTHRDQLKGKVQWKKKLNVATNIYSNSEANGVWVVDSDLDDQKGTGSNEDRFSKLIEFHNDLKKALPENSIIIAGPYWGINLILWAKGLCDYPAISVGSGYRYYISGGFRTKGNIRVPISPLRRWAVVSPELKSWIEECLKVIPKEDRTRRHLVMLKVRYDILSQKDQAKDRLVDFYKSWFDKIENISSPGRALALYQDFSSAYVLGSKLPDLPRTEGTGRKAERVPQQFMLNCL